MADGGTALDAYELSYRDLSFGSERTKLGEGSFGTVYKATFRGEHEVAVKTVRMSKIDEAELAKFKSELIVSRTPPAVQPIYFNPLSCRPCE